MKVKKKKKKKLGRPPKKRKTRKTGRNEPESSWERLPKTPAGKQVKIQFYLGVEWVPRLKRAGMIAVEMNKIAKDQGITRNTPGMYCQECCVRGIEYWERILEIAMKQGENNAITSNTHNS